MSAWNIASALYTKHIASCVWDKESVCLGEFACNRVFVYVRACVTSTECQKLAWKAGHKGECVPPPPAAGASTDKFRETALQRALGLTDPKAKATTRQNSLCVKINDLYRKSEWKALSALETEARIVGMTAPPDMACFQWRA